MVKIMSKTLEQLFNETKATTATVGNRINSHVDRRTTEVQETTAKVGKRINAHTDRKTAEVQETVAKVGTRVNAHSDSNHAATRAYSYENHTATRQVVRDEAERTRRSLKDYMEWPEIIFGLLCGILAGIGMWLMERNVILKPLAWDKAGNVTKYGPDTFMVIVLAVVLGIFVFFCISWLVHAIRHRNR